MIVVLLYSLADLRDAISAQTNISASDQLLLFENHELNDIVDDTEPVSMFLHTSPSNPLYLFSVTDDVVAAAVDSVLSSTVCKLNETRQWRLCIVCIEYLLAKLVYRCVFV